MPLERIHLIITHARRLGTPPKSVAGAIAHCVDFGDPDGLGQSGGKRLLLRD